MEEKNGPKKKYRAGTVTATVWENEVTKEGKSFTIVSVTVEKNYKDKNDNWQTTNKFSLNEVPKLLAAVRKAYDRETVKEE